MSYMESKYSPEIQAEIDEITNKIQRWQNIFDFKTEFYYNGWAISLREKSVYPRCIIIFKSFDTNSFSIKSFEIHLKNLQKEEYKELYCTDNLNSIKSVLEELKEIIYGKDLIQEASRIYRKAFMN